MEGLYFHCSLSLYVCVSLSVSEQNSIRRDAPIRTQFLLNDAQSTGSDPVEIDDLESKVKVKVT